MQLLDGEIAALLAGQTRICLPNPAGQATFEHALRIAQEVDVQTAPPALDGLRGAAAGTAAAYRSGASSLTLGEPT